MVFDLIFIAIFLFLEWYYYKAFREFENQVLDQLLEVNKRLEIALEKEEK